VHKPVPQALGGIPPLIKHNTLLLALSQSFVGAERNSPTASAR
jgi:hypothetical protein